MIQDTDSVFPSNVIYCLTQVLPGIDERLTVLGRPLRSTDPNFSIGIFATLWQPDEQSYEMGSALLGQPQPTAPAEPTLSSYTLGIQCLVKDGDEQRGLNINSILAKRIRSVLYRNEPLRVALGSLSVTDGDSVERMRRWGMRNQRYMNNDIEGTFVYISTLDYWIETEMR